MSSALLLGLALAPLGGLLAHHAGRVVVLFTAHDPGDGDDTGPDDAPGPPPPSLPGSGRAVPWARWSPLPWRLVLTGRGPGAERVAAPWPVVVGAAAAFAAVGFCGAQRSAAEIAALAFLALWGTLLTAVDLRVQRLPDALVRPAYPVALALLAAAALTTPSGTSSAVGALVGMAGMWAVYWLLWFVYPPGMGWGDVKLSGLVGLHLGWFGLDTAVAGAAAAFLLFTCVGLVLIALGRAGRRTQIPFGPFMIGGALLVILLGDSLPLLTE
ncbi:prepilin peptidase [Thermobifida halotolerans]|nr:A24 family peptidase [Thermobifida halotolerans]